MVHDKMVHDKMVHDKMVHDKMVHDKMVHELMTCKYCLLFELGHCRKTNPMSNEPRYLRLRNGTLLRLHFDCSRCEMQILRA